MFCVVLMRGVVGIGGRVDQRDLDGAVIDIDVGASVQQRLLIKGVDRVAQNYTPLGAYG